MPRTNPGEEKATEMQRAFNRAFRAVKRDGLSSAKSSAGFIDDPREPGSMRGSAMWAM